MIKRFSVAGAGLLVAILVTGCGGGEVAERPPPVRPIKTLEISEPVATVTRVYPGRVGPVSEVETSFEVAGRIVELPVSEGQYVQKGQLLARLDASDFEARQAAAEADVNAARSDFERYRELLVKDAVSQRDFESRQRNLEVAEAQLQIARTDLADTSLRAPFSGRVARKIVDDFQSVQAKQPIVLLQDASKLEIRIDVPEADMALGDPGRPPAGLEPVVTVTAFPDHAFAAEVSEMSTAADPVTRTFEATLTFKANASVRVLPGMTARVSMTVPRGPVLGSGYAVPSQAVATDDSGSAYVWKLDPTTSRVSRVVVEMGPLSGSEVLLTGGVVSGDVIAISGVHHLREGMEVRPQQ